jgi:hypothetical protein
MATYTANIGLTEPDVNSTGWGPVLNANFVQIDAILAVGGLGVQTTEVPSTTLNVKVAPGFFVNNQGVVTSYAGTSSLALTTASNNYIYLTNSGTLTVSTSAFPTAPVVYVPIAQVAAGATTITAITDSRSFQVAVNAFLPVDGGTVTDGAVYSTGITTGMTIGSSISQLLNIDATVVLTDGVAFSVGTTAGYKIGVTTSQRIGFYGKTPIAQSVMTSQFATSTWTTVEQNMLNTTWALLRNIGLGS